MTVAELKEELNKFDDDMEVNFLDYYGDYITIRIEKQSIVENGQDVTIALISEQGQSPLLFYLTCSQFQPC